MKYLPLLLLVVALLVACGDDQTESTSIPTETSEITPLAIITTAATPTLLPDAEQTATALAQITPSPTPTPTATPALDERLELSAELMQQGNYDLVIEQLARALSTAPDGPLKDRIRHDLGRAHLAAGNAAAAQFLFARMAENDDAHADALYYLGQSYFEQGNCAEATPIFRRYLNAQPELTAYTRSWIAQCALLDGEVDEAIQQYELAVEADSQRLITYQHRVVLAGLYGQQNRFSDAANLYAVIRDEARTEYTKAEMGYFSAEARIAAGDEAEGYAQLRDLVNKYPQQNASYRALVKLVQADEPVDQYFRGVIDYFAQVYSPCVVALEEYIEDNPNDYIADARLYLAGCYEALGERTKALAEIDKYTELDVSLAGRGLYERGELLRRQGLTEQAISTYQELVQTLPSAENAPDALWQLARIHDLRGDATEAVIYYQQLADDYPENLRSAESLFRAGWLAREGGSDEIATDYWLRAAETYRNSYHGESALTWLYSITDTVVLEDLAAQGRIEDRYYSARVADLALEIEPFAREASRLDFELDQDSAEDALRQILELPEDTPIDELPPYVANDPHLIRGEILWRIGRFEDAKRELDHLRQVYHDNILISYQLALYLRDVGLYRSSIMAAANVINLLGETPFTAPKFIVGLAYPVYYDNLILPLADKYSYDPLVQFALVRQESLYESFATSTAVAQGLAQVIPDTGRYIADKLRWPDYVNADLYKPYVGLEFGGFYLAEQLALFDGSVHAALAAYNGGPGNALRWYNAAGNDIDLYVETVNFRETRAYIERIYVGYAVYRHLYTK